jgi:UDP-N-acetylglucosamine 2-epimerase
MTIVGARPEFIKAAPLCRALAAAGPPAVSELLVHTGQHYDRNMSGAFFDELGLPEPLHLGVGSASHGVQTARILERVDGLLLQSRPDLVIVFGDTNSTLAGALAAAKLHVPVAHVEAGLRSWNPAMPEEINRRLTDHAASLLLCPSGTAVANLAAEGIESGVHLVGDVNLDALLMYLPPEREWRAVLDRFGVEAGDYALATVHRAENTDDPDRLLAIANGLAGVADAGLEVVLPIHPRTRARMGAMEPAAGLRLIDPVGYRDLIVLAAAARVGLTDSGGVQKELYWLGTPCVTLRHETEWVETLAEGRNVLAGTDSDALTAAALAATPVPGDPPPVYGRGDAAEAIVTVIGEWARGIS